MDSREIALLQSANEAYKVRNYLVLAEKVFEICLLTHREPQVPMFLHRVARRLAEKEEYLPQAEMAACFAASSAKGKSEFEKDAAITWAQIVRKMDVQTRLDKAAGAAAAASGLLRDRVNDVALEAARDSQKLPDPMASVWISMRAAGIAKGFDRSEAVALWKKAVLKVPPAQRDPYIEDAIRITKSSTGYHKGLQRAALELKAELSPKPVSVTPPAEPARPQTPKGGTAFRYSLADGAC